MKNKFGRFSLFCKKVLEYSGILKTAVDIGSDEIRIMEFIKIFGFSFFVTFYKMEYFVKNEIENCLVNLFRLFKNKNILLTLSTISVNASFSKYPGITPDRLKSMVIMDMEKRLPVPIENVYYNYKSFPSEDGKGLNSWGVFAVASKKDEVDQYLQIFNKLGKNIESVYYLPLHIIHAIRKNKDKSCAFIVISSSLIEIYAFNRGILADYFSVTGKYSEKNSMLKKNIVEFISSLTQTQKLIIEKIVIVNKTNQNTKPVLDFLTSAFQINITMAENGDFNNFTNRADSFETNTDLLGFSKNIDHSMEIAPLTMRSGYAVTKIIRCLVLSLLLFDIATIIPLPAAVSAENGYEAIGKAKNTGISSINDDKTKELSITLKDIDELKKYQTRLKELEKKIREIKSTGMESSRVKIVLAEIARLIPESVWLKDLSITGQKGELEGLSIGSEGLEGFVTALTGSKIFGDVTLKKADLVKDQKTAAVQFNISFGVRK